MVSVLVCIVSYWMVIKFKNKTKKCFERETESSRAKKNKVKIMPRILLLFLLHIFIYESIQPNSFYYNYI